MKLSYVWMKKARCVALPPAACVLASLVAFLPGANADEEPRTTPVTFDWPEGIASGSYSVRGLTEKEEVGDKGGNENKKLTIPVPDGKYELRVGDGIVDFAVRGKRIAATPNPGVGVSLDVATKTFRFDTVSLQVEPNGFVMPLQISGVAASFNRSGEKPPVFKVVPSQYRFSYGGNRADILVGTNGKVQLAKPTVGIATADDRLILKPQPFNFEPGAGVNWNITRGIMPYKTGNGEVLLLPGSYSINVQIPGKKGVQVPFYISQDFLVAAKENGPYSEVAAVSGDGVPDTTITIPNGRAVMQARLDKIAGDKKLYENFLATSEKAAWKQDFILKDYMRFFNFPEESLSYDVTFPAGKVRLDGLQLTALYDEQARAIPFQLSNTVEQGGFLKSATITFRGDLPKGAQRLYRLTYGIPAVGAVPPEKVEVQKDGAEAVLKSNRLLVKVLDGEKKLATPLALAQVPAPLLSIARNREQIKWLGSGKLVGPDSLKVTQYQAQTEITGALFARQRVTYRFTNNATYTVTLTLSTNDDHVAVAEAITGLKSSAGVYFRFDMNGLDPDQRQVMSNDGYAAYSGAYKRDIDSYGRLPFQLGLYIPNSLGIMRAAAFWKDGGEDVLLLALDHLRDWKTETRMVWGARRDAGTLVFGQDTGSKYFQTRLEGQARFWAMGVVPLDRAVPGGYLIDGQGGGPEIRLWQKLSDFSLNRYKDWPIDWDEDVNARPDNETPAPMTFEEWMQSRNGPESTTYKFLPTITALYWDSSSTVGPVSFRGMPSLFETYAASRANWTLEQRRQARTVLLYLAYSCEDDANMPHHAMLGGHPNFAMDVKQTLALACATFPNHPDAKKWRDSFMQYFNEFLDAYQRKADPDHNAMGGRWTEAMACYSGTALHAILQSAVSLERFDGTDLFADPRMHLWMQWYRTALMSPQDGVRLLPPEGAHSDSFEPDFPNGYRESLFETARLMKNSAPQLSDEMRWIETNGKEGTRPDVRSTLVRDQGPFMHSDFGGPNESYLHFMQLSGPMNYRWGLGDMLYYGAKGKVWSYNGREDTGDEYDINNLTSFSVGNRGLGMRVTDQPLYDFGFAQFYRALANATNLPLTSYKSRGMMMLRDDYIALSDEMEDNTKQGQFAWSTAWDFPQIYQLKPGIADYTTEDLQQVKKGRAMGMKTVVRRYKGAGDFLTVVAPTPVNAQAQPYGALVNGEYVFMSDGSQSYAQGTVRFQGTAGYARKNQLALFEGTEIGLDGFLLQRSGGDFGVSADASQRFITGRIVGRDGGQILMTPPAGFDATKARVQIDGKAVQSTIVKGAISFPVTIALSDGAKSYRIDFGG